ncbi:hypothetical protein FJY69_07760, partial [candidate division WOR-3 bacterium]|nr:hypothetical protein [candidate division WOR-3 bacterium]
MNDRADTVRGRVFYVDSSCVYYRVTSPVNQLMSWANQTLSIYYPAENTAFVTARRSETSGSGIPALPLPQARQAEGLRQLGYAPVDAKVRGDTVIRTWRHKGAGKSGVSDLTIAYHKGLAISQEQRGSNGRLIERTEFSRHERLDTFLMPTRIVTSRYDARGRATIEAMNYAHLDTSPAFLDSLNAFRIPPDARVK